jgi:transcription elongation GreA/GreB family factor
MDKKSLVEQLARHLRASAANARREGEAAAVEAREGASPQEKSVDARVALEYANLARAQGQRATRTLDELASLEAFRPGRLPQNAPISVGAIVEVEDGEEGRTFFLAPAGAGVELTMPDGDGFLTVVTPASPLGRAVLGRKRGDTVEIVVKGEPREWTISYVA